MNEALMRALLGLKDKLSSPPEEAQEDIVVSSAPAAKRKYHSGFLGGPFAAGTTGGNILGVLGDALLTHAGKNPMYAPRLQGLIQGEALQGVTSNPDMAIESLAGTGNAAQALDLYGTHQNALSRAAATESLERSRRDDYEDTTHTRAGALIRAATPETWTAVRKRALDYYAGRGVDPLVDLPETYDEALVGSLGNAYIPAPKQAQLEDNREYRASRLAQGDRFEGGRNRRSREALGVRTSEGAANRDVRVSEGDKDRVVKREGIAARGGRARPGSKPVRVKQPDGTYKFVIK